MGAPMFAIDATSDPVMGQIRQFAAIHGVPVDSSDLPEVLARLRTAGLTSPGLAYASWADSLALGGVLTSILTNNPTIGSMLEDLERFHPLLARDRLVLVRRQGSVAVGVHTDADTIDAIFGMLARGTLKLAGALPQFVHLRRPAPPDIRPYQDMFGEVAFGQADDRCVFAQSTLDAPVVNADPAVLDLVRPYADRRLAHTGLRWTDAVTRLLTASPHDIPRLADVAMALSVSPRTLQTRLSAEGHRFADLAEAVQRDRALALLAQSDVPITTIAQRSGFSTAAAFTRAFRRWTATTPSAHRQSASATEH